MPDIWRHPGMAPDWSQIVAVSESWPRAPFLMFSIPLTAYFQLPSRVRWFSRCWAVSIRSSSLLSRDASASRRKLAHLWKSSSFTTYKTGRGLLVTLSGYTNGAPHSSWGAGPPIYWLGLRRIGGKWYYECIHWWKSNPCVPWPPNICWVPTGLWRWRTKARSQDATD